MGAARHSHAIVVDEGRDFARSWLESLYLMLADPDGDVLYVFHDPEQALYRDDVVATLGLLEYFVDMNCRNGTRSTASVDLARGCAYSIAPSSVCMRLFLNRFVAGQSI